MLYLSGVVRSDMPAMLQPGMGNLPPVDQPWAADNGRFSSPDTYSDERYLSWLAKRPGQDRCLFATAPDVVGDAAATLALSTPMFGRIRAIGYPVALVAQDGLEHLPVPWDDFDALFIGGTTHWKLSEAAHELAADAKRRGKWVHMGRVNSLRRVRIAAAMGCDSVDGTYLRYRHALGTGEAELRSWLADLMLRPRLLLAAFAILALALTACTAQRAAPDAAGARAFPETAITLSGLSADIGTAIEGGVASFVGPEYGPRYLALPDGPGHRVRICGEACVVRVSTDAGPDLEMQRQGRIADVSYEDFRTICGGCDPYLGGLWPVSVEYLAAAPTPPQTDTEGAHHDR